jgi:DNA primase
MIVDRDIVDYSTAQVLDMEVGVNVEEVKRSHRIEDYINDITFTGDHWGVAKCPFHEDANPSFWVDTEKQLCGCFSGCTTVPLDVINLVARLNNLSNSDAIRQLGAK